MVAGQVGGLHLHGVQVACGCGLQRVFGWQCQAPHTVVHDQSGHGGAVGAVAHLHHQAGLGAVDDVVDPHHKQVGVASIVGATQGGRGRTTAADQHCGYGRRREVNHHPGSGAGFAPVARQIVLYHTQMVGSHGQRQAAEGVCACAACGGHGNDPARQWVALCVQQTTVGTKIHQTHTGVSVGCAAQAQTRRCACETVGVAQTGV